MMVGCCNIIMIPWRDAIFRTRSLVTSPITLDHSQWQLAHKHSAFCHLTWWLDRWTTSHLKYLMVSGPLDIVVHCFAPQIHFRLQITFYQLLHKQSRHLINHSLSLSITLPCSHSAMMTWWAALNSIWKTEITFNCSTSGLVTFCH